MAVGRKERSVMPAPLWRFSGTKGKIHSTAVAVVRNERVKEKTALTSVPGETLCQERNHPDIYKFYHMSNAILIIVMEKTTLPSTTDDTLYWEKKQYAF